MSFFSVKSNVGRFRAAEEFSTEGRLIKRGEVLEKDDPLVALVLERRPDLLIAWWRKQEGINCLR
jgi:hypothetical protein